MKSDAGFAKVAGVELTLLDSVRYFHKATGINGVAQIAKEAGVADGTIYLYFKNKDDILVQFFSSKAKQVFDCFRAEVGRGASSAEKLRNLVRVHLGEFQRDPDMAVVYQIETHQSSRLAEDQIREMAKMYQDILAEIVEQGQQEGAIRKDLYVGLVKRFILGAVEETIGTWLHSGRTTGQRVLKTQPGGGAAGAAATGTATACGAPAVVAARTIGDSVPRRRLTARRNP